MLQKSTIMQQTLATLDSYIQNLRPELYIDLQSSLSAEEFRDLEQQYDMEIPQNLKALYRWKNGQRTTSYEVFVNNSTFIPLGEALDTAQELTNMIGMDFEIENWWNEYFFSLDNTGEYPKRFKVG